MPTCKPGRNMLAPLPFIITYVKNSDLSSVNQVCQNSAVGGVSPLGNIGVALLHHIETHLANCPDVRSTIRLDG